MAEIAMGLDPERKSEKDLCETFSREINAKLGDVVLGVQERFEEVFGALLKLAATRHLNVVIDEFQEFRKINIGMFSSIQKIWDLHKGRARINLIVTGSVNTLKLKGYEQLREIVRRDYPVLSGHALEVYFRRNSWHCRWPTCSHGEGSAHGKTFTVVCRRHLRGGCCRRRARARGAGHPV